MLLADTDKWGPGKNKLQSVKWGDEGSPGVPNGCALPSRERGERRDQLARKGGNKRLEVRTRDNRGVDRKKRGWIATGTETGTAGPLKG